MVDGQEFAVAVAVALEGEFGAVVAAAVGLDDEALVRPRGGRPRRSRSSVRTRALTRGIGSSAAAMSGRSFASKSERTSS